MIFVIKWELFGSNINSDNVLRFLKGKFSIDKELSSYSKDELFIQAPCKIGLEDELFEYFRWYVNFMKENYKLLESNGIEKINLFTDIFYEEQCNFEFLDSDMIRDLSKYNVSFPISVYKISNESMSLLKDKYNR